MAGSIFFQQTSVSILLATTSAATQRDLGKPNVFWSFAPEGANKLEIGSNLCCQAHEKNAA
jgi:hypothetical protein